MKNFYMAPAVEIAEIESEGVFAQSGTPKSVSCSSIGFETASVSDEEDW